MVSRRSHNPQKVGSIPILAIIIMALPSQTTQIGLLSGFFLCLNYPLTQLNFIIRFMGL